MLHKKRNLKLITFSALNISYFFRIY